MPAKKLNIMTNFLTNFVELVNLEIKDCLDSRMEIVINSEYIDYTKRLGSSHKNK